MVKVVVDLGYSSFRLSVYDIAKPGGFRSLYTDKAYIRLGEGIYNNVISAETVERSKEVMKGFAQKMTRIRPSEVIAVGTSPFRYAINGEEVAKNLSEILGYNIKIVSGEEEGISSSVGVINTLPIKQGLIVDIGNGSLELVNVKDRKVEEVKHFPLGALKMFKSKENVREEVRNYINYIKGSYDTIYATGGNVRAVGKLDLSLKGDVIRTVHGHAISRKEINDYAKLLSSISLDERLKKLPGMNEVNAVTLPTALTILDELMDVLGAKRVVISAFGFREGLVSNNAVFDKVRDVWIRSIYYFYNVPFPEWFRDYDPLVYYTSLLTMMFKASGYLDPYLACFHYLSNATLPGFSRSEVRKMMAICYYAKEREVPKKLGVSLENIDEYSMAVKGYTEAVGLF